MHHEKTSSFIDDQFGRLQAAAGTRMFRDLAAVLGVKPSAVSDAKRRGRIPMAWIDEVARSHGVSAEWILTGAGSRRAASEQTDGDAEEAIRSVLRGVPARLLAEELLRRIQTSAV